jgi:ABC-type branched-subunit amino acid transport system substrate-binding protein
MRFAAEPPAAGHGVTRRAVLGGGLVLTLAGCNSPGLEMPNDGGPVAPAHPANGPLVGETMGAGPVRVGMILPLTQNGAPSPIGASMRNAAQLAISDSGSSSITLMIEDDHSSPDAAAQAAQAELGAGTQLILGPVFASGVRSASAAAKSAGKPMIAFSTDVSVAAPGVYLLSFLIQGYVDRILQYAVSNGKKSFAVMTPQNDYGNVAADRFQDRAQSLNVQVVVNTRYASGQMAGAAQQVAAVQGQIDALFIPEQADAMPAVASALEQASVKTQFLGTGVWNDPRVLKLPQMQGAWFSAPDNSGFDAFAQRYKAKFNSEPARLATLAYDAVTLAAALARGGGPDPFNQAALTSVSGFNGADGVFRFRADGTNERGLAVMQIADDGAKVISPAPRSFAAG